MNETNMTGRQRARRIECTKPAQRKRRKWPAWMLAVLAAVVSGMPALSAQAATTTVSTTSSAALTASVDALAAQIAALSAKTHDGGLAQQLSGPVLTILSARTFDWNEVLFGTDTLTAWQQQTATALTPDLTALVTEQDTTQVQAEALVNSIISAMQSLDSAVQASDVVTYLNAVVTDAPAEIFYLIGLPTLTPAIVAQNLHTAFAGYVEGASAPIQSLFAVSESAGQSAAATGTVASGTGASGGAQGGGTSGGGASGGASVTGDSSGALLEEAVGSSGGFWQTAAAGLGLLSVRVPADALSAGSTVTVTSYTVPSNLVIPRPTKASAGFALTFSPTASLAPLGVTIVSQAITRDTFVYTVGSSGLAPFVGAQVLPGRLSLAAKTPGTFLLLQEPVATAPMFPSMLPVMKGNQRAIDVNGKVFASIPSLVVHGTTYLPIGYVMNAVHALGIGSTWKSGLWSLHVPGSFPISFSNLAPGKGTYAIAIDTQTVLRVPGLAVFAPAIHQYTMYMPIALVMQVLSRLNLASAWNGKVWTIGSVQ